MQTTETLQTSTFPQRELGDTGVRVSSIGLGGSHLGKPDVSEAESIRIIQTAIDNGITFLDNSWDYNEGQSELRMGKALRGAYRERAFLMTKIDGRTRKSATAQIEESLRRLQTDHVDLLQLHEVIRLEDADRAFAPNGAMAALIAAREAGKTRFLGFTGHKSPDIHLHMLSMAAREQFRFDTVQLPLNVMDAHYDSFERKVLPLLVRDNIGVLGMKPIGGQVILDSGVVTATECLQYALNLPTSVVITGVDSMAMLEQALEAGRSFKLMTAQEMEALLAKTAAAAQDGDFEKYKTTEVFDSTSEHPEWLG